VDAAQSGVIGDNQQVWLETTVVGPTTVGFWWKVSSEAGCDVLSFYVDGVDQGQSISGNVDWQPNTFTLPAGTHTLNWSYSKDGSVATGSDCGWVDQVAFGVPVITREPFDAAVGNGESTVLKVTAMGDAPLAYQWYMGESGNTSAPVAAATNTTFLTPPVFSDTVYWVRIANAKGTVDSWTARVRIGFEVSTLADLQKIGTDVDGWSMDAAYRLMDDIDAAETALWNDEGTDETTLEGFRPIGMGEAWVKDPNTNEMVFQEAMPFTGTFDGKGHVIRSLTVNRPGQPYVGLFGYAEETAMIQSVGLVGNLMIGGRNSGGLVGQSRGTVARCYVTGQVSGGWAAGGLIGENDGMVAHCYATGSVKGGGCVGGFVGQNEGQILFCYASAAVDDGSGLVAEQEGSVVSSYWNTEVSGQDESAGGMGRTSVQMRQQVTYVGWENYWSNWAIQEGEGEPYLRIFAEGQTAHETPPTTLHPANLTFVWPLRPVLTAGVSLVTGDYVNARWQIATEPDFSNAFDWLGSEADDDPLRTPFSCRVPVEMALTYGKLYYWRVRLQTGYGMWSEWSSPALFLVWEPVDKLAAGKDELSVWINGVSEEAWKPDYLFGAHDAFAAAIQKSGTNYEARIYRAMTTLAKLTEDQELRSLLADFGYTFDASLFSFTGAFAEVASPLPNEAVDRIAARALPAISAATADLAAIPTNWTGSAAVSPELFPIDETVYVDCGDVLYTRAVLGATRSLLETAQAYDLTLDYGKTNFFLPDPVAPQLEVSLDGDESEWTEVPATLFGERCQLEYAKIVRSATQVYVLARLAEGVTANNFWLEVATAKASRNFWFGGLQKYEASMDESGVALLIYGENVIELLFELLPEEQGEVFHLENVGIEYLKPLPAAAPLLVVTLDGAASEWGAVPEVEMSYKSESISTIKIARSETQLYLLLTLKDGEAFDTLTGYNILFGTYSGSHFGAGLGSYGMTFAKQGSVLEVSYTFFAGFSGEAIYLRNVSVNWQNSLGVNRSVYSWFNEYDYDDGSYDRKSVPFNQLLADHPACLSAVRNPGNLPSAKAVLREALTLALAADGTLQRRTDSLMHVFEYDPEAAQEQADLRQRLQESLASLTSAQHIAAGGHEADVYLGAFFATPFVTRACLPRFTSDNELVVGTFPDPTFRGILPARTQAQWQEDLLGVVPLVRERAFTMDGQTFTTGGYAFWDTVEGTGGHTNVAQSGTLTNARPTWVETTLTGPGRLSFSWEVTSRAKVDNLCLYVDGVRQAGSISGESGWLLQQVDLPAGRHTVRWAYVKGEDGGAGADAGWLDALSWSGASGTETDTPVPVPYAWLDGFSGLVQGGDYNAAAWADQDKDGKTTWEEYVSGTSPTNAASVFLATIVPEGTRLVVGWTPDLSPARVYTVEGKSGPADSVWSPTNAASRFFRVKVQMP
jgi:hypothetical protein